MTDFESEGSLNSDGQDSDDNHSAGTVSERQKVIRVFKTSYYSVNQNFYEQVTQEVLIAARADPPKPTMTLKELCGPEFWPKLSP